MGSFICDKYRSSCEYSKRDHESTVKVCINVRRFIIFIELELGWNRSRVHWNIYHCATIKIMNINSSFTSPRYLAARVFTLRWRHNDHAGVSNHQPPGCLLNRLFRRKSKKTSKLRVTGLCAGNSPGTGEFSAQMASYAENVSIWWRHHVLGIHKPSSDLGNTVLMTVSIFRRQPWHLWTL